MSTSASYTAIAVTSSTPVVPAIFLLLTLLSTQEEQTVVGKQNSATKNIILLLDLSFISPMGSRIISGSGDILSIFEPFNTRLWITHHFTIESNWLIASYNNISRMFQYLWSLTTFCDNIQCILTLNVLANRITN